MSDENDVVSEKPKGHAQGCFVNAIIIAVTSVVTAFLATCIFATVSGLQPMMVLVAGGFIGTIIGIMIVLKK